MFYRRSIDGGLSFGPKLQAASSSETMYPSAIYHNARFHMIWSDFRDNNQGAEIYYRYVTAGSAGSPLFVSTASVTFPTTSVNSVSAPAQVSLTNVGTSPLTISALGIAGPFAQSTTCGTLASGASCVVNLTFAPIAAGSASGTLSISFGGIGSPASVGLSGFGSYSLVDHYYQAILGRAPDAGGKTFWEGEAVRMQGLGVDIKEAYRVMAGYFFNSPEYIGLATSDTRFVTDLYNTFFNRAPDAGGFSYWMGQLANGLPRNIVMYSFLFSPEFGSFMTGLFGNTTSRAEVDAVVDYYRGILSRLPDTPGFNFWHGQFSAAQCSGSNAAGAVYTAVDSISSQFIWSSEYTSRNRTNTEYVSDLYYAFLRRGGDPSGINFWIDRLNRAVEDREQMRRDFIASPEFTARVNAIIAQGC
ncbi:MAG: DUF4214 domain-containing protein, partial [Pseudomonadota bacterium]|nr:DUF4214 domain-containing protein [Pseudomonadota bacterium]